MLSRRRFIGSAAVLAGASAISVQAAGLPEAPSMDKAILQPPLFPRSGPDYQPVVTLNGWTLPWRMNGDWKESHLVAEPVVPGDRTRHESAPLGLQRPIARTDDQAVEGDKVRIFVISKLPEHTTIHWHGMLLPSGMDGVGGMTQPHIQPGKNLRLRVCYEEERDIYVSPARR